MNPGTNLGPYEIIEQLGAGGMGEVWLAQDTRLGRKVAVKVLPEEFAADPERLARFEQEARAAAALNHPNIAAVHDVGVEGGTHFMVQEYLQGHTLRTVIDEGTLDLKRSLQLGTEITEALAAAHRGGIVHRDLKPENIFVTEDGHAKVLDFGLAKLTEMATGPLNSQSMSPTVLGTQQGAIMGTAGYMAPEQVQGEEIDARADVFAFGCVLWEMLSGQRAFAGKSVPHTLHRILDEEPEGYDSEAIRALPLRLRWLLDRTLAKSPADRAQSSGDVLAELRQITAEVDTGTAVIDPADRPAVASPEGSTGGLSLARAIPAAALLFLAGAALAWMLTPAEEIPARTPTRFAVELPDGVNDFANRNQRVLAISPDGTRLAFVADNQLWLRALDDLEPVPLRGTDEPRSPSFSPDGEQIAFWADDQIKRVGVSGGAPVVVGPSEGRPQGVSWADDGFIYVGQTDGQSIYRLPETGGQPETIVDASEEDFQVYGPRLLPGGEWLMFTASQGRAWSSARILAQSLVSGEQRQLLEGGHDARYVPTGHLLYATNGVLLAVRLDLDSLTVSGGAVPMLENLRGAGGGVSGAAYYSVSKNGHLAYITGSNAVGNVRFGWVGRQGQLETLPIEEASFQNDFALSPDERRIAVTADENSGDEQVWIYSVDRPGGVRLTNEGANDNPVWSPDGEFVYFESSRGDSPGVWRRRADLSAPAELVLSAEGRQWPSSISRDGEWLYYITVGAGSPDVMRLNLAAGGDPETVVATEAPEFTAAVSPNGEFVAFVSAETQNPEVFVIEVATGRRTRISTAGGASAVWSLASDELYYYYDSGLWSAAFELEPQFSIGVPVLVRPHVAGSLFSNLNLTGDNERTLERIDQRATLRDGQRPRVDLVLDWFTELSERAPLASVR